MHEYFPVGIADLIRKYLAGTPEGARTEDAEYRKILRDEILEEIRNDPANTAFGMPLPEVYRLVLEHQAKRAPIQFRAEGAPLPEAAVEDWMRDRAKAYLWEWSPRYRQHGHLANIEWSGSQTEYHLANFLARHLRAEAQPAPQPTPQPGGSTPYTLREDGGKWVAHALAFDLVGVSESKDDAVAKLKSCLGAQIAFGVKQGLSWRQCFFPAPAEYWIPPYEFMLLPSDEELAAFKFDLGAAEAPQPTPSTRIAGPFQVNPDIKSHGPLYWTETGERGTGNVTRIAITDTTPHCNILGEVLPEFAERIVACLNSHRGAAEAPAQPTPKCKFCGQIVETSVQLCDKQAGTEYCEAEAPAQPTPATTLREQIFLMMKKRQWSTHWIHRSAYLHLESAELAEAVRGKHGDTLDESADVLITLLALSPHELLEIEQAAQKKVAALMTKPRYAGETGTFGDVEAASSPSAEPDETVVTVSTKSPVSSGPPPIAHTTPAPKEGKLMEMRPSAEPAKGEHQ